MRLARPPRAVGTGGQGAQGERQRRRGDEQQRDDHRHDHVHHHVHGELHPAPDVGRTARGPDERDPAEGPQHRAVQRPGVTATRETADATGIQTDGDDRDGDHEPVGPPLGQPVGRRHRTGVGEAGDRQHRARRLLGVRDGRGCATEDRAQPERGCHEPELDEDEPGEPAAVGGDRGDDPAALLPAEDAERDEDGRLGKDHRAVGRPEARERAEPDDGLLQAGDGDERVGPAGEHRVARDRRGQVRADARLHEGDREQSAGPDRDTDEVDAEEFTASSWLALPAECPVRATMTMPDSAMAASHAYAVRVRARSAPSVTTSATAVEIESTRVTSSDHTNVRNCRARLGIAQAQPRERGEGEEDAEGRGDDPDRAGHRGEACGLDPALGRAALGDEEGGQHEQAEGRRR